MRTTIDSFKERRRRPGTYAWWYRRYWGLKRRAKQRNLEFELTLDDYKELREAWKCYYCSGGEMFTIDRKDNNMGYSKKNTIACCYICNSVKGKFFSESEMLILGKAIKKIGELRSL